MSAPYNLIWGSNITVKVTAVNIYGSSTVSVSGGGAIIVTVPDAPINIVNVVSVTNASQIGLSWSAGVSTGGSRIIDYEISYHSQAAGGGFYMPLVSKLTETSYTVTGLNVGTTYSFRIRARNEFDFSAYSSVITVLAA